MDPGLERLFRLREERDMEIDPDLKMQLNENFLSEVRRFVAERQVPLDAYEFIHATVEAYRQWRRNPH